MRLHSKFSVVQMLEDRDFDFEMELCFAKVRMERKREIEEEKKITEKEAPFLEVVPENKERRGEKRKRSGENR